MKQPKIEEFAAAKRLSFWRLCKLFPGRSVTVIVATALSAAGLTLWPVMLPAAIAGGWVPAVLAAGGIALHWVADSVGSSITIATGMKIGRDFSRTIFDKVAKTLGRPLSRSEEEIFQAVTTDAHAIEETLVDAPRLILEHILRLALGIGTIIFTGGLSLGFVVAGPIVLGSLALTITAGFLLARRQDSIYKTEHEAYGRYLRAIKTLETKELEIEHTDNAETLTQQEFKQSLNDYAKARVRKRFWSFGGVKARGLLMALGATLPLVCNVLFGLNIPHDILLMWSAFNASLTFPATDIGHRLDSWYRGKGAWEKTKAIYDEAAAIIERDGKRSLDLDNVRSVTLQDVEVVLPADNTSRVYGFNEGLEVSLRLRIPSREEGGVILALVGPNGSGKSTLLRLLGSFITPTTGTVLYDDESAHQFSTKSRRNLTWMVHQDARTLRGAKTVREALQLSSSRQISDDEMIEELHKLMLVDAIGSYRPLGASDRKSLERYLNKRITSLSAGHRHRVAFLQGVLADQRVLLVDEPTSDLSPAEAELMFNRMAALKQEKLVVVATHDIASVKRLNCEVLAIGTERHFKSPLFQDDDRELVLDRVLAHSRAGERHWNVPFEGVDSHPGSENAIEVVVGEQISTSRTAPASFLHRVGLEIVRVPLDDPARRPPIVTLFDSEGRSVSRGPYLAPLREGIRVMRESYVGDRRSIMPLAEIFEEEYMALSKELTHFLHDDELMVRSTKTGRDGNPYIDKALRYAKQGRAIEHPDELTQSIFRNQ